MSLSVCISKNAKCLLKILNDKKVNDYFTVSVHSPVKRYFLTLKTSLYHKICFLKLQNSK